MSSNRFEDFLISEGYRFAIGDGTNSGWYRNAKRANHSVLLALQAEWMERLDTQRNEQKQQGKHIYKIETIDKQMGIESLPIITDRRPWLVSEVKNP